MSRVRRGSGRALRTLAGLLALVAVGALALVLWPSPTLAHASAHFPRTVGLYTGSDVRILGVKVGKVTAVVPEGTSVRVDFEWDASHKVPRDAQAVVVAPSVVSDRYVQLTPVYRGGPVMADGTDIPLARTATPVELDRIYSSLDQLSVALGPKGANSSGALTRLLKVGADNLDGQGAKLHSTLNDVSSAVATLSAGREDLFGTVRNLQTFTSALAADDTQVRQFNSDLADVSEQLSGERGDLALALRNLGAALTDVSSFVKDNRASLQSNVAALAQVTQVLSKQQKALGEFLTDAPVALSNLQLAYNASSGTLDTRDNAEQTQDPASYLCSLLISAGQPPSVCGPLQKAFDALPKGSAGQSVPGLGQLPQLSSAPDKSLGGILGGTP